MKRLSLLLIIGLALLAGRWLFKPGIFPIHDDLQVARLYEMHRCWEERQIPCRWVPDMGYGFGYPLFNFYPPFPYYLGEMFHLVGVSFINSIKIVFLLGLLVSGIGMFLLGREFFGTEGGLLAAGLYLWAPYHAVDLYVRGAMNEFWAMAFFPFIFWSIFKVLKEGKKYVPALALSYAGLLLSHNIMSMLFVPISVLWGIFLLLVFRLKKKNLWWLIIGGGWGGGLAAFFVLPAFFEKKYVHVETMFIGYFNYLAHFVSLKQLFFSRFWGYGSSVWGENDGMPFQIGLPHWPLALLVLGGGIFLFLRRRWKKENLFLVTFLFLLFVGSLFLTHLRAVFIWKHLSFLHYLQFPWRFLALATFFVSFLGGGVFLLLSRKANWLVILLLGITLILNYSYFRPEKMILLSDEEKLFSSRGWYKLQTDAIFDYLPKSASLPPSSPAPEIPVVKEGVARINSFKKGTNWMKADVSVFEKTVLWFPAFCFPGWKAWVNKEEVKISCVPKLGVISLSLPAGAQNVYLRLVNTPIRSWGNFISLVSWWLMVVWWGGGRLWRWIPKK